MPEKESPDPNFAELVSASSTVDRTRVEEASEWLAAIVHSSNDAIIGKDSNGIIISWNATAERLFGYSASEIIGKPGTILFPPDHIDEETRLLERVRRGERTEHFETVRRRKDGSLIEVSLNLSPVRDAFGKIIGASKIVRDNTERKRADERQELILGEMRHRAANLNALIAALANQSRSGDTPAVDQFLDRFLGRLRSILAASELALASASRTPNMAQVIASTLKPFVETYGTSRIKSTGPSVLVSEQIGSGLALAVHKLATNAVKYGALSSEQGTVSVTWTVTAIGDHTRLELEWREQDGPVVTSPSRAGFGTRVIKSALSGAKDGSVEIEFAPGGLCCRMAFLAT